jgi:hypothetical protein
MPIVPPLVGELAKRIPALHELVVRMCQYNDVFHTASQTRPANSSGLPTND